MNFDDQNNVEIHEVNPTKALKVEDVGELSNVKCQGECGGKLIPKYPYVPEGYESPEIWKLEETAVNGINGIKAIRKQLCKECYRKAWKRAYPDEPLPI